MRIVVDLQACQSGSRLGGIGRYSKSLTEALARNCGGHELRIILSELLPETIPGIYQDFSELLPRKNIQVFHAPGPVAEILRSNSVRARAAELIRESFIEQLKPDILHVNSVIEGLGEDVVCSVGRLFGGQATSATLYDLIPLVEKDKYLGDPMARAHYYRKLDELKRAGSLLAISEFSRQQAIDELGIDSSIIANIAAGVDPKFRPIKLGEGEAAAVRQRYGIRGKFLLYTSSFDQRKNHARLVEAYGRLPRVLRESYQLLCIGNGWDGIYAQLRGVGKKLGLQDYDLIFAGHVPDSDLLALYNLCDLFVFPSLSEGYGLPVLEAMSCGIPTIASNTTSIPEVVGWGEALFNPYDIDSITSKMVQALTDRGFRSRLKEHGLSWSKTFTWDRSAKMALAAFEDQHERNACAQRLSRQLIYRETVDALDKLIKESNVALDMVPIANALASNEVCLADVASRPPKIGWVTTWNTRCGIAMYAKYLAGAHVSDYTIFAPHDCETLKADDANVIRSWRVGNDDLRELAEHIFEAEIDTLVIQFQYGFFEFHGFASFLQEMISTGRRIYITMHATADSATKRIEQIATPLRLCDAVFVHSTNDVAALGSVGLKGNVEIFPHGVVDIPVVPAQISIPPGRFVIATYGFFLPHKGLLEIIEVLHLLVDKYAIDAHLLMVNAEYPVSLSNELIAQANARIEILGLSGRVTLVTDFLEDEESLGYLSRADLVVYPYQETSESSSAAVRMGLAAQRPIAVTPLKIFDDVIDNVFLMPATDVVSMAKALVSLRENLRNPNEFVRKKKSDSRIWRDAHGYSKLSEHFWRRLNNASEHL